jgi:cytochrome c-type biogenesis protein CcmH
VGQIRLREDHASAVRAIHGRPLGQQDGQGQEQITEFMVSRYGDFVLYRPPVQPSTYLLWFGPFLFLLVGVLVLVAVIGRQRRVADSGLTAEERSRLDELTGKRP